MSASHAKVKFNRRGTCQILRRVSCSVSITVRLLLVSDESKKAPYVIRTGDIYRNNIGELILGRVISFLLYKHNSHKISLIGLSSEKKNPRKCALFI